MTELAQSTASVQEQAPRRGIAGWVVAVIVAIAVGLGLGLGYFVFSPPAPEADETGVSAQEAARVVALLDAYEVAWNANDADAVLDLFSDDFVYADGYTVEASDPALRRYIARMARANQLWEYVGDPVVVRSSLLWDVYAVAALWKEWTTTSEDFPSFGVTIYRVVDEDGELKINRFTEYPDWFQY